MIYSCQCGVFYDSNLGPCYGLGPDFFKIDSTYNENLKYILSHSISVGPLGNLRRKKIHH